MTTITKDDILKIGEVSTHCDLVKLEIAISEARDFDLEPLFCPNWDDIQVIFDKVAANDSEDQPTESELNLINGGSFTGCNEKTTTHKGIKAIWSYYAYARYKMLNGFNDTPNGTVAKQNNFSIPTPLKEVEMFSDKYRSMGYASFEKTSKFICASKDDFEGFNIEDCEHCKCDDGCDGKTKAKGYGFQLRTIKKDISR